MSHAVIFPAVVKYKGISPISCMRKLRAEGIKSLA